MYVDYDSALEMCGLQRLHMRREHKNLQFALRCLKNKTTMPMFPPNPSTDTHNLRYREKFLVNKCHTECYRKSTIPYLQGKLNQHFQELEETGLKTGKTGERRMGQDQTYSFVKSFNTSVPMITCICTGWCAFDFYHNKTQLIYTSATPTVIK